MRGDDTELPRPEPPLTIMGYFGEEVDGFPIMKHQEVYLLAHLDPSTDPIARAICQKLDIDWETLLASKP